MMFRGKLGQLGGMSRLAGVIKNKTQNAASAIGAHPSSGNLFLYLALIIFILDFIGGQYTGFKWVWGFENIELAVNILTSSVFATIMLIYVLLKVIRRDWAFVSFETLGFVFFAFIMTFFILNNQWFGTWKAGIHFAYILFFGFTFMKTNEADISTAYIWTSVFLLLDFFGYSLLQNVIILRYLPIILIFPSFYVYQKSQSKVSTFFLVGIIIIMFIFAYQDVKASDDDTLFTPQDVGVGFKTWFNDLKKGGKALVSSWQSALSRQIQFAITGKVEENEYEPLGVYLENVQPTAPRYYIDKDAEGRDRFEEVIIWGTVKGRTLDDPINIEVGCFVEKGREKIQAKKRDPEHNFTIFALEEQDFACTFTEEQLKKKILKKGSNIITTFANFNFETLAYLRVYFINRERQRAMVREGLDVFDELGIVDRNPVPVYTNGPVAIEMGTTSPLVGVSESYIASPRFSLAIKNRPGWEGRITGLRELVLLFPEGVVIENPGINKEGDETKEKDCNLRFKNYTLDDCSNVECDRENDESCKRVSCNRVVIDCTEVCNKYENEADKNNCKEFCNEKFEDCNNQCKFLFNEENQEYIGYALAQSEIDLLKQRVYKEEDVQKFQRFNCKIKPIPSKVLENIPITTKFIRVKTRYDYTLEEPVSVNIVEAPMIESDDEGVWASSLADKELIENDYSKDFREIALEFTTKVKRAADSSQEICRVEFSKYPEKDGKRIKMVKNNGNLQIIAEDKDGDKKEVELLEIKNHVPCIVEGTNFWGWLMERDITVKDFQNLDLTDVTITSDNKMAINEPITIGLREDVDLYEDRPMIYKAKTGRVCLIPEFNDGTIWDGPVDRNAGCDLDTKEDDDGNLRNYVDNDCLNKDNDYLDVKNEDGSLRIPICVPSEVAAGTGDIPADLDLQKIRR